ncbi:MAG: NAD(P)-binding domain-containing protein, partial [Pseudomonadota bacterium]
MSTDILAGLTIGSVGGGHMASAILAGLVDHGVPDTSLVIREPNPARQAHLLEQFPGASLAPSAVALAARSDIVLLAVKPQVMPQVMTELRTSAATPLYLSIAAGITLATLSRNLPAGAPVIRSMPNLGATLGRSVTGLLANAACTAIERNRASAVAGAIGSVFWVTTEQDIDAITAVAGSGPAYLF